MIKITIVLDNYLEVVGKFDGKHVAIQSGHLYSAFDVCINIETRFTHSEEISTNTIAAAGCRTWP